MYILGQIKSNFKGAAVHQTCQFINGGCKNYTNSTF